MFFSEHMTTDRPVHRAVRSEQHLVPWEAGRLIIYPRKTCRQLSLLSAFCSAYSDEYYGVPTKQNQFFKSTVPVCCQCARAVPARLAGTEKDVPEEVAAKHGHVHFVRGPSLSLRAFRIAQTTHTK